jgi:hypothetical protein
MGGGGIHQRTRFLSLRRRGGRFRHGGQHARHTVEGYVRVAVVWTEPLLYYLLIT